MHVQQHTFMFSVIYLDTYEPCKSVSFYIHIHTYFFYKLYISHSYFSLKTGLSINKCGCIQVKWISCVFKCNICKYNRKLQNTAGQYLMKCTCYSLFMNSTKDQTLVCFQLLSKTCLSEKVVYKREGITNISVFIHSMRELSHCIEKYLS